MQGERCDKAKVENEQIELLMQETFSGHVDRVLLYPHSQAVPRPFALLNFVASESECTREICGLFGGLAANLEASDDAS